MLQLSLWPRFRRIARGWVDVASARLGLCRWRRVPAHFTLYLTVVKHGVELIVAADADGLTRAYDLHATAPLVEAHTSREASAGDG